MEASIRADTIVQERWILTGSILASSMAFIDGSALNVALPVIQTSLGASGAQLLWVVNAYLLMLAALILVGGSLGDRLGRRRIFMLGIGLFGLASLTCGLAPSIQWLIVARVIQGVGGALMIPGSLAILSASLAPERRGKGIGAWSAVTTLVTVAGPVLGGFLADLGFWRGVFLINLPIGLFALWVIGRKVPESRDDSIRGGIDWPGALLVTVGLGSLTYGFLSAPERGFGSPEVWGVLLLGAAALAGFGLREATTPAPMAPVGLFRSHTFLGTNLLTLFLYGALAVNSFFFSLNLVQVQGYSKTLAGLAFLPFTILLVLLSRWSGGWADRRGPRLPLVLGPAAVGMGFLWLSFAGVTAGPGDYWVRFFPGITLMGLGMGLTVAPLTTAVMSSAPSQSSGAASGINNAVSRTAGVLAIAITGALALTIFAAGLRDATAGLGLPEAARGQLLAQAANLAGAQPPAGLTPTQQEAARAAIRSAFADTFRVQMQVCTGLAWLSALLAALLVERKPQPAAEQADG